MKTTLLFFLVTFAGLAGAAEWVINKDHSEIFFSVPYLNVSEVTGRFSEFKGSAVFDEAGKITQLDMMIKASSLNTENRLRDSHLKAPDFLNTRLYPEITFVSTNVKSADQKTFMADGMLTLHGKTVRQTIRFELSPSLKDSWGFENRFAKFDFPINRKDFNLVWNKTLAENKYLVGDTIQVKGNIQLQPIHSLTPGSKHFIPVTSFTRGKERLKRGEISQEEFEKTYMTPSAPAATPVEKTPEVTLAKPAPVNEVKVIHKEFRDSFKWWVAFGTLGLMGFFASILIGLYSKTKILELFPNKYQEEGVLGNLSDIGVIVFTLIYAMAYWYVGWGH